MGQLAPGLDHPPLHGRGQLGVVGHLDRQTGHDLGHVRPVDPGDHADERRAHALPDPVVRGHRGLVGDLLDGFHDHLGLARPAPVDRRLGDAGAGCDSLDRHAPVARLQQQVHGRGQDGPVRLGAAD